MFSTTIVSVPGTRTEIIIIGMLGYTKKNPGHRDRDSKSSDWTKIIS